MKFALFVFNGEGMCFIHVLLNALEMHEKGHQVKIVMEGASAKLVPQLDQPGLGLATLWKRALEAGLVAGVCKACASKLGTLEASEERGLPLLADISGHPSILQYRDQGYEIITF
jgi:hypothetical protein